MDHVIHIHIVVTICIWWNKFVMFMIITNNCPDEKIEYGLNCNIIY